MYVFESLCADCFATKKLASIRILKHKARVAEVGSLSTKAKMPTKTARRDKCVVFARNCTVANLIQYNYAIYTKRHCFWPNMCVHRVICVLARLLARCAPSAGCSWSPCPSPSSATTLPTSTRVRGGRSRSKRRGARGDHLLFTMIIIIIIIRAALEEKRKEGHITPFGQNLRMDVTELDQGEFCRCRCWSWFWVSFEKEKKS